MFNQTPLRNQYLDPDSCLHPTLSTSYRIPILTTPTPAQATATPLLEMAYNSSPLNYYQLEQQKQQPSPNLVLVTPSSSSSSLQQTTQKSATAAATAAVQQKPTSSTPTAPTAAKRSHTAATLNTAASTDSTVGTSAAVASTVAAATDDAEATVASAAEQLPAELRKLFEPLFCQLCKVQSNSPSSARMHYDSKVHHKRVTQWLQDWALRTGEPLPKRAAFFEGPTGPDALHCRNCDLALTSLLHAQQHYMGRRHKAVMHGVSKPSGAGFYDAAGKWTRTGSAKPGQTRDFGEAFVQAHRQDGADGTDGGGVVAASSPSLDEDGDVLMVIDELERELKASANTSSSTAATVKGVICTVCNISVSAQSEMQKHLEGKQHAKKLRAAGGVGGGGAATAGATQAPIGGTVAAAAAAAPSSSSAASDHSANRTPSGQYYCKPCNLTLATEHLFGQHVGSKKHTRAAVAAAKNVAV